MRVSGSALPKKPSGRPRNIRMSKNKQRVRKSATREEVSAIPEEMTDRVMDQFRRWRSQWIVNNGRQLSDNIFKI